MDEITGADSRDAGSATDGHGGPGRVQVLDRPEPSKDNGAPQVSGESGEFRKLRRLIRRHGLMDRQPAYYTFKIAISLTLLAGSIAFLVTVGNLWLQLLNAAFMGFAFSQISFLGHDAGHYQIARSARGNEMVGLFVTFLIAMDLSWWVEKHNRHHANPNQLGLDDDIEVSVLAFTEEQALGKPGYLKPIVRFQAFFFYPILFLSSLSLRFGGVYYLLFKGKAKYPLTEPLLIACHAVAYFLALYLFLGLWQGALFLLIHQSVAGFFMGATFAPNHKGMPVLDRDSDLDFLRKQIITSRNVRRHPVTDLVYGGLNYQIEHHLFPSMPRNNLGKAQVLVKEFCRRNAISYHETSVIGSNCEILSYLHRVSRPLRTKKA